MLGLLALLTLGLIIAWAIGVGAIVHSLTHPPRRTYAWAVARGMPSDPFECQPAMAFETWTLDSQGRTFDIWDIKGTNKNGPTAILCHGWGDSRLGGLLRARHLRDRCARVLLWDMPGHGESPGRCTLGTKERTELAALINTCNDRPIILYGWSMGAGLCIAAAAKSEANIIGVIAEAPYSLAITPARAVISQMHVPHTSTLTPAMWLLGIRFGIGPSWRGFDRTQLAASLTCPLLVIHGTEDDICPYADGKAIAEAAPRGEIGIVEHGGHNDLWTNPHHLTRTRELAHTFIQRCMNPESARPRRGLQL